MDPEWLAKAFSSVISLKGNFASNGVVEKKAFNQLWKNYDDRIHEYLFEIFQSFNLGMPFCQASN